MIPLSRRTLALVTLALALAGWAFAICVLQIGDPDAMHHLALGRDIVRNGLRAREPFLYPLQAVENGPMPHWLGAVAIYAWQAAFGMSGLSFLPAAVGALVAIVLALDSSPRGGRHTLVTAAAAAIPLVLAAATFRYRATPRTEIFAVLFIAVTLHAIRRFEDGRPRLLYALPILAIVWTNIHTTAVVGLGLIAICLAVGGALLAVEKLTAKSVAGALSRRQLVTGSAVALAFLVATFATPAPMALHPVFLALRLVATAAGFGGEQASGGSILPFLVRLVDEMKPPGLGFLREVPGYLYLLTGASFLLRWRLPRWRELATFIVFACLATTAIRFALLFATLCAPFAARNLGEALERVPERLRRVPARAAAAVAVGVAAVAMVPWLTTWTVQVPGTGLIATAYPARAVDYLRAIGFDGRVYNTFHFGGYLEWRGISPFIDGRGLVPPGEEQAAMIGPSDRVKFRELTSRYGFEALILQSPEPEPGLEIQPGSDWLADVREWALVAFDDNGLLFLRRNGKYAAVIARDEYQLARPSYAPFHWPRYTIPGLLEEYRRSVREAPACVMCRYFHAFAALADGHAEEALETTAPVIARHEPHRADVVRVAARAADALARTEEARALYEELLSLGTDDLRARRALAMLALKRGDPSDASRVLGPNLAKPQIAVDDAQLAVEIARQLGDAAGLASWDARLQDSSRRAAADDLNARGFEAYQAKDNASAISFYESAIATYERHAKAHSNLGYAYHAAGRLDDALREHRRAVELDPSYAGAYYGVAMALEAKGDAQGAASAFRRYLKLEPSGYFSLRATQRIEALERL